MAVPGKGRVVASVLVIIFIIVGFFFFDPLGSKYPEGVDTDAIELRSVTLSGDNYEAVTYDDELYELPVDRTPAHELADSGRDFLSRNRDELWFKADTVERLGIEGLDVIGGEAE